MINETIKDVVEVVSSDEWPSYYVVTDEAIYEYTGQTFLKRNEVPDGKSVEEVSEARAERVAELRGDGETSAIILERGDAIVFDLVFDPFGATVTSSPKVRYCSAEDIQAWVNDLDVMSLDN